MEKEEFHSIVAALVFDGYSPDDIADMARASAEAAKHEMLKKLHDRFKKQDD